MAFTYGFFNSLNHDRVYDALDVSSIFDGILHDGIIDSIGECLKVTPGQSTETQLELLIGTGRAWFHHTWSLNTSKYPLHYDLNSDPDRPDITYDRIDAIVLEVDSRSEVRENTFKIIHGEPAADPQKPPLIRTETEEGVNQYPLAYVTIRKNATAIFATDIEDVRATSETGFAHGVLEHITADQLLTQWREQFIYWSESNQEQFNQWFRNNETAFYDWFATIQDVLDEDTAGHLYNLVNARIPYDAFQYLENADFNLLYSINKEIRFYRVNITNDSTNYHVPYKKEGENELWSLVSINEKNSDCVTQFAYRNIETNNVQMHYRKAKINDDLLVWGDWTASATSGIDVNGNAIRFDVGDGSDLDHVYMTYSKSNGSVIKKKLGSLDPATLTATPADVLSGKIFGGTGSDDPQTGTLGKQEKTATPATSAVIVTPDSGKLLSKVTVNAVSLSGNATAAQVLKNKTFYNTSLSKVTGSMVDKSTGGNTTLTSSDTRPVWNVASTDAYWIVTNADGQNSICLKCPQAGYYSNSTILRTKTSNLSQTKSATPSLSAQNIVPDSGKLLSSVTVNAIPANYTNNFKYAIGSGNYGDGNFDIYVDLGAINTTVKRIFAFARRYDQTDNPNITVKYLNENTYITDFNNTKWIAVSSWSGSVVSHSARYIRMKVSGNYNIHCAGALFVCYK